MKKLLIFVLLVLVLGLAAYGAYRFYLPTVIAEALTSDEPSPMVPAGIQKKVGTIKVKVDREIKKLPVLMKETKIGYEDLLIMIDRAKPDDFFEAYREISATRIVSTNQVFDIGMKHINIEGFDLEIFRSTFNRYATVEIIREAINNIDQNEILTSISIPVAKETVKKILESSEQEIRKGLKELESK